MNIRLFFIIIITLSFTAKVFAQTDDVTVVVNGKLFGKAAIGEDPAVINVNKLKYKKVPDLTVMIRQSSVNRIYKRTLQITDEKEQNLFSVPEQRSKIGSYKINLIKVRQQLLKQSIIKVFLAEDPANDMMRIPSKRKLLAELHLK